ncbi:MAG: sugar phosphate isomerase/epimerase family protein [Bryobacteraceae bacterium]
MMKISNYSLNYARRISQGQMDIFGFLDLCRKLGIEGASLHVRDLPETGTAYLKKVRRGYLDRFLSMSMFTVSTNFGNPRNGDRAERHSAFEAIRAAIFLGAPIVRVFAGSPPDEAGREKAFARAAESIRAVCEEGAQLGMPIGLQNHNHGALCRTGAEMLRMIQMVSHPNLTILLDTGQFAGSKGASAQNLNQLKTENYIDSIRMCAPLARHVRTKFYNPDQSGSEPWIDYNEVFNILRGVHYEGWLDIVYEPGKTPGDAGESIDTAMPRIVSFLRSKAQCVA